MAFKTVDAYIASLSGWQAEVVSRLREIILDAAPEAKEAIKWAQPVYEQNGPFAYIKAFKNSVNFGFWRGVNMEDPEGILEGTGDRMRHIKISGLHEIRPKLFQEMVKNAVALNREHGDPTQGA